MAKIKKKLSMLEEFYFTVVPIKQDFFKKEFIKHNQCSESTFYRRLSKGDSLDDLALFQFIFGTKIFENNEVINQRFKGKNITKWSEEFKNQYNIF